MMKPSDPNDSLELSPDILAMLLGNSPRRVACVAAALDRATPVLTEVLTAHRTTGHGKRVRHVLWSLYTASHMVNLGEACCGLDRHIADALLAAIAARLVIGPDVEPALKEILRASGEFSRFDEMERSTPDHLPVIYPPPPVDSQTLREMADALDHLNAKADED